VSEEHKNSVDRALACCNVPVTCIGQLNGMSGKVNLRLHNQPYDFIDTGYEHFAPSSLLATTKDPQ
ncbi:MAG: thiamine-monophosphate kinase, partial [Paraglaciecola sp.]